MEKNKSIERQPIVVILGHVDHGKTTLLDYIRQTKVASREAGGITQGIGASEVITKEGKEITLIDTPGHAAFANMRSQGANVADIAVLVVAGDDGVKPQTKEALAFIRQAEIPFIVAATKIDLPSASVDKVKIDLEKEQVSFEGRGGEVPLIGVSGRTGKGVDELLDTISLISQLKGVSGDPQGLLEAVVIETHKDQRGPTAAVIVRNGSLRVGEDVASEKEHFRIRGLFNFLNKPVKEIGPGKPALVLGFAERPEIGNKIWGAENPRSFEKQTKKEIVEFKAGEGKIPVVLKAQSSGSLEAVVSNLPENITPISTSVGDVNESDIFIAKAASATIFAFESRISTSVKKLAETEGVNIESFDIIYKLFERLEEIIKKAEIVILGKAEIVASFPYENKRVAGCKIIQGEINKNDKITLIRDDKEVGKVKIVTMRKLKVDIEKAKQGEECGIIFSPHLDFKLGDVLLSVRPQ